MSRINLFSPSLNPADSYGGIANNLSRHLATLGVTVNAVGWQPGFNVEREALEAPNSDGTIFMGWPTMFPAFPVKHGQKIAITMWESSKPPPDWIPILNEMDAV